MFGSTGVVAIVPVPSGETAVVNRYLVVDVVTMKLCVTGVAAAKAESPPWLAVIEQVPTATIITVLPETVQTEDVYAKLTASPELAVALSENGETPRLSILTGPKVIVCGAGLTVKLCDTVAAAA